MKNKNKFLETQNSFVQANEESGHNVSYFHSREWIWYKLQGF